MNIYDEIKKLLKLEKELRSATTRGHRQVNTDKNAIKRACGFGVGIVVTALLIPFINAKRYACYDAGKSVGGLLYLFVVAILWVLLAVLGICCILKLIAILRNAIDISKAKSYKKKNDRYKADLKRRYELLRDAIDRERSNYPELASKELFFDCEDPTDNDRMTVPRGALAFKPNNGSYRYSMTSGEINIWLRDIQGYRFDDFHNPKYATFKEVYKLITEGEYVCPLWDKEYMLSHADQTCMILSIQQFCNEGFLSEFGKKYSSDIPAELKEFYDNSDAMGKFMSAGVDGTRNLSSVDDTRRFDAFSTFVRYYEAQVVGNPNLKSTYGIRHGSGIFTVQKLGYIILEPSDNSVRGFAIPDFYVPGITFTFSYDTFTDADHADEMSHGKIFDIMTDRMPADANMAKAPDFMSAVSAALDNEKLSWKAFDMIERGPGLSDAQWHYWLTCMVDRI